MMILSLLYLKMISLEAEQIHFLRHDLSTYPWPGSGPVSMRATEEKASDCSVEFFDFHDLNLAGSFQSILH